MEHSTSDSPTATPHKPFSTKQMVLCSLRVVSVCSEHFLGRRYVMELATESRARELRVYRSLDQLMSAVADLGLPTDIHDDLHRQLIEHGSCNLLNILL